MQVFRHKKGTSTFYSTFSTNSHFIKIVCIVFFFVIFCMNTVQNSLLIKIKYNGIGSNKSGSMRKNSTQIDGWIDALEN